MSDGEPKANRTTCNENEVAKVAKPSDLKRHNKHNADRTIPNENEESNITKPSELKSYFKHRPLPNPWTMMIKKYMLYHLKFTLHLKPTLRQQQQLTLSGINDIYSVGE